MFDGGSLKIMLTFPLKGVFNFIIFLFGFLKIIFRWRWIFEHSWKIRKCRLYDQKSSKQE